MYRLDLKEMHQYYSDNISGGNYPISLELSRYLYNLCWKVKPNTILDRGSGFSSFLFRKYAFLANTTTAFLTIDKHRALDIYTVDNKKAWLDTTKIFLEYCGLPSTNMYTWSEFLEEGLDKKKYDLILEDYSFPYRPKSLPLVLEMLAPEGYLILDDANLERYDVAIKKAAHKYKLDLIPITKETKDKKGRFAALIRK